MLYGVRLIEFFVHVEKTSKAVVHTEVGIILKQADQAAKRGEEEKKIGPFREKAHVEIDGQDDENPHPNPSEQFAEFSLLGTDITDSGNILGLLHEPLPFHASIYLDG